MKTNTSEVENTSTRGNREMNCKLCDAAGADEKLFTTFIRCGEGDATKRTTEVCDECCPKAVRLLDAIGMIVAFEGDGQTGWDALVIVPREAEETRNRRRIQRETVLVSLLDRRTSRRPADGSKPETLSILHELKQEGLIESTVDRDGEFWPEDNCRLTDAGDRAAREVDKRLWETEDDRPAERVDATRNDPSSGSPCQ